MAFSRSQRPRLRRSPRQTFHSVASRTRVRTATPDGPLAIAGLASSSQAVPAMSRCTHGVSSAMLTAAAAEGPLQRGRERALAEFDNGRRTTGTGGGFNEAASARSRNYTPERRKSPANPASTRPRARARGIPPDVIVRSHRHRLQRGRERALAEFRARPPRVVIILGFNEAASARSRNSDASRWPEAAT